MASRSACNMLGLLHARNGCCGERKRITRLIDYVLLIKRKHLLDYSVTSDNRLPPLMETITKQTRSRGSKSFLVVYCTLRPPYSGNLPTLNHGHSSHAPTVKINKNFPSENGQSHARATGLKIFAFLEEFSCIYSFDNVLKLLCI